MAILDDEAGSGFAYTSGTGSVSVTVPDNCSVKTLSARAANGTPATLTIAGGEVIPIPGGGAFAEDFRRGQLPAGTVIVMVSVDTYYVSYFVGPGGMS